MTEDSQDFENAKKLTEKEESENQLPANAHFLPHFTLTDEEMQNLVEAISYAEYGILNDSVIE